MGELVGAVCAMKSNKVPISVPSDPVKVVGTGTVVSSSHSLSTRPSIIVPGVGVHGSCGFPTTGSRQHIGSEGGSADPQSIPPCAPRDRP